MLPDAYPLMSCLACFFDFSPGSMGITGPDTEAQGGQAHRIPVSILTLQRLTCFLGTLSCSSTARHN